ncbi:MAG: ATP-binding cassette domain-containing protein [Dehalococcoidia bacterium]|nr:ATP-binding cassette domain-containing protein [Dehalococcoidia bacterium]
MIRIKNLSYQLDQFSLKDLNLSIEDGEYFVILGPTGAGKTVLLECVAGLHKVSKGEIWINGSEVTHLTPEERGLGYVPQDYVLFPFLNVMENIVFGIKRDRHSRSKVQERLTSLANLMGISSLLKRDVRSLSGGEKQRVALARALAPAPRILLLDEPLSSLDLQTAKHLRLELKRIHRELGVTTLHITHNQAEAEELADRIAIIHCGRVEQVGKPNDVFFSPENETVSNFIGALNILECRSCRSLGPGLMEVDCGGMRIILPHDEGMVQKVAIFPRDIYVSDVPPPGPSVNRYKGKIRDIKLMGSMARLEVEVGENILKAEIPQDMCEEMNLASGKDVYLILRLRLLRILNKGGT